MQTFHHHKGMMLTSSLLTSPCRNFRSLAAAAVSLAVAQVSGRAVTAAGKLCSWVHLEDQRALEDPVYPRENDKERKEWRVSG
eukprot:1149362-Pelagomonas_calceolata.AAC.4